MLVESGHDTDTLEQAAFSSAREESALISPDALARMISNKEQGIDAEKLTCAYGCPKRGKRYRIGK